tara:strand:+ start:218 stop:325 length:108 start_codon:yes stop_codon:yes gene_type:complete
MKPPEIVQEILKLKLSKPQTKEVRLRIHKLQQKLK